MEIQDFVGVLNLEESAGLEVEVAIADYQDVLTWPALPDLAAVGATNMDYVDLGNEVFVMKTGKKFHKFEGSLEKNGFQSQLVGPRGAKTWQHTLTISRNAVNKSILGWLRANRNRQLVVAFRFFGETQYTVIGFNKVYAEVDDATVTVSPEVAGEKGTAIMIRAIYYPPLYIDAIPFTPAAGSVAEVASLLITAAATGTGDVTVTLDGTPVTVAVATSDTAIDVATKIRAATFAGWTTGGTGDTVTFTANVAGPKVDAAYSAGTTGATGTMTTTVQGS